MVTHRHYTLPFKVLRCLAVALLLALSLAAMFRAVAPIPGHAQEPEAWTFQGRVYEGEVGDESRPLQGVTVSVYGANSSYPDPGVVINSTVTNEQGWYSLEVPEGYEFYSIRAFAPPGDEPAGATTVDGTVRTNDWIEYVIPLEGKTLTGNMFWDRGPATETPSPAEALDLAILAADRWEIVEDGQVLLLFVEIGNQGDGEVPETAIWAGEPERGWESTLIPVSALAPREATTVIIELGIPDDQRGFEHVFLVRLDPENLVPGDFDRENNETRTPPIPIPAGPPGGEQPRVTAVDPDRDRRGQEMTLMIFGENFASGAEVFIPEGIDILYVEFIGPSELEVRIAIDEEAPLGPRPVEVVNPEGLGDVLEEGFTVLDLEPTPEERPDLVVSVSHWEIVEDGRALVIVAEIGNGGDGRAPGTIVRAEEPARRWASEDFPVPELGPGDETRVEIWLEIPEEQRGTTHTFIVAVDPEEQVRELDEENNVARTPEIFIPPPPPETPPPEKSPPPPTYAPTATPTYTTPPPPPLSVSIWTDKAAYQIGDLITIYFKASVPVDVWIVAEYPDGSTEILTEDWVDPGVTHDISGEVEEPVGDYILHIYAEDEYGNEAHDEYHVTVEPPPVIPPIFIYLGGVVVAVGVGVVAVRLLRPKPKPKPKPKEKPPKKLPVHVKAQYYNMTISNDSEKGIDDVEVSLEVSPPSFLVKVIARSRIWERMVQVGSLGPGESKEIDFVTATVMPEIKVPLPVSLRKPSVTVRYTVHGEAREHQLKPNEAVLTDDHILMRLKLQFDLDSEIAGLRKDFDTIRDIIVERKIKLPKALYNVLTVQNGSKAPISDVEVALDVPVTQILVGKRTFSMPVIGAGDVGRIRFGTIKPEFKALELLGKVRARMRYQLMGKSYDVELETGEVMKTPENVITEIKVYDLKDRINLLKALRDEIKEIAKPPAGYCQACGQPVSPEDEFCPNCSAKI